MSKPQAKDPVVIRVWKGDSDDVFALFPTDPADNYGRYCTSYQHVGQHGSADYDHCIRNSRPASRREAAPLLTELRRIGYRPHVLRRASRRHHDERLSTARGVA
jgi:hypothetical protein